MGKGKYVEDEEIKFSDNLYRFEQNNKPLQCIFHRMEEMDTKFGTGWRAVVTDIDNDEEKKFFCTYMLKNLLDKAKAGDALQIQFTGYTGKRKDFKVIKLVKKEDD